MSLKFKFAMTWMTISLKIVLAFQILQTQRHTTVGRRLDQGYSRSFGFGMNSLSVKDSGKNLLMSFIDVGTFHDGDSRHGPLKEDEDLSEGKEDRQVRNSLQKSGLREKRASLSIRTQLVQKNRQIGLRLAQQNFSHFSGSPFMNFIWGDHRLGASSKSGKLSNSSQLNPSFENMQVQSLSPEQSEAVLTTDGSPSEDKLEKDVLKPEDEPLIQFHLREGRRLAASKHHNKKTGTNHRLTEKRGKKSKKITHKDKDNTKLRNLKTKKNKIEKKERKGDKKRSLKKSAPRLKSSKKSDSKDIHKKVKKESRRLAKGKPQPIKKMKILKKKAKMVKKHKKISHKGKHGKSRHLLKASQAIRKDSKRIDPHRNTKSLKGTKKEMNNLESKIATFPSSIVKSPPTKQGQAKERNLRSNDEDYYHNNLNLSSFDVKDYKRHSRQLHRHRPGHHGPRPHQPTPEPKSVLTQADKNIQETHNKIFTEEDQAKKFVVNLEKDMRQTRNAIDNIEDKLVTMKRNESDIKDMLKTIIGSHHKINLI
jgi:hypothetical protein